MSTLRIVADENMPLVRELFSEYGEINFLPGRSISSSDVKDADAILVRSVTKVDASLLHGSRVRFVGSATIGADHVDTEYLRNSRIEFANAPGCNANAVAEYVIACLDVWRKNKVFAPYEETIGVVGYGNVGKKLVQKLKALKWPYKVHDPLLAQAGYKPTDFQFVDKNDLLQCDVISLHTPLTRSGEFATRHWLGANEFTHSRVSKVLNTCRGPVVDNLALYQWLTESSTRHAVLDVWESEPQIDAKLMAKLDIATPHIAGYSMEGKSNGTRMVHSAFCKSFGISVDKKHDATPLQAITRTNTLHSDQDFVLGCLHEMYQPLNDDERMRQALQGLSDTAAAFDELRKNYPERRELLSRSVTGELCPELKAAFFNNH